MQTNRRSLYIGVALLVLLAALAALFFIQRSHTPAPAAGAESASTTTTLPGGGSITTTGGSATITELPVSSSPSAPAPDYTKALTLTDPSFTPDVIAAFKAQFAGIQTTLAGDATNFDAWVRLGELRKMSGDFVGAEADWRYISALYPKNTTTFGNLGDLYMNFIKNYPKSEAEYVQETKNNPTGIDAYEELYRLYTVYGYKTGTSAAPGIIKAGIAAAPTNVDLHVILARYYRDAGDVASAKLQYDAAIALTQSQSDATSTAQLRQEKAALPQ